MTDKQKKKLIESNYAAAYWAARAEDIIVKTEAMASTLESKLKTAYELASERMQSDLEAFYGRYAKNNNMSLADARATLDRNRIKSFRDSQNRYIKYIESIKVNNKSQAFIDMASRLAAKSNVTRIEEIQSKIRFELEKLAIDQHKNMTKGMKKAYQTAHDDTADNIQKGINVKVTFTNVSGKQLEKAVQTKWIGDNFSDRIWSDKEALVTQLERMLPQEFVRGRGVDEIARDLSQRMDVSFSNCVRLVRTEMNYITNQGTLASMDEAGFTEYDYEAILDDRTSAICQELNGQTFKISEAEAGVNLPPMHPHCRSTIVPHFEKGETSTDNGNSDIDPNEVF